MTRFLHESGRKKEEGRRSESGITVLEMLFSMVVIAAAAMGALSLTVSTISLESTNRETAAATSAVRAVVEELQNLPFDEVFREFNADPSDDPRGIGTGRGSGFSLTQADDGSFEVPPPGADAMDGKGAVTFGVAVEFPVDGSGNLVEDGVELVKGMPRDLNADGVTDVAIDRSADYKILPCKIVITWQGASGPRTFHVACLLTGNRKVGKSGT